ncbi:signal recognition particle SRP9/SRP14 subunit [Stereum hirsutum FP-91666 SS1]|uniref:signal recognition particle SRP9/SRP14 subunit n=1 Tax=Stereum hirsutum (strain FP-91666) TaxID=721885 RepID=UPI000444989D|nr:signal recognition particle SRP9/SRP14 subunit [Stereum hirsutum FP-91666 SS1]EIM84440.1 signal recognition particle SRP9/SRP14 subunit [Stereum hirsutum FP-91666 SS1]
MVYISSWQKYQEAAEALYAKSPQKARYCVKFKQPEGKLVLKITDDETCLKFKTHSSVFLNRFEALNLSLMEKMVNSRPPPPPPPSSSTPRPISPGPVTSVKEEGGVASVPPSTSTPTAGGTAGGGTKKKKGKKKK